MTLISKNVCIDKLDDIVHKYSNRYHRTIEMRSVGVNPNIYINSSKEINDKNSKCKFGDIARISKYIHISAKVYVPNWCEEVFVITNVNYKSY